MTRLEIEKKVVFLEKSLDLLRLYQEKMIKQIGKRRYDDLVDDSLDQYIFYTNLLKNQDYEK